MIKMYVDLLKTYLRVGLSLVKVIRQKKESVISGRKP